MLTLCSCFTPSRFHVDRDCTACSSATVQAKLTDMHASVIDAVIIVGHVRDCCTRARSPTSSKSMAKLKKTLLKTSGERNPGCQSIQQSEQKELSESRACTLAQGQIELILSTCEFKQGQSSAHAAGHGPESAGRQKLLAENHMMMVPGSKMVSLISLCGRMIAPFKKTSSCVTTSPSIQNS